MTTHAAVRVTAHPIDPARLDVLRAGDDAGCAPVPWAHPDGLPLRCCLRRARPDDRVVLLSYAPRPEPSPWREVGPVFVHAERCAGFDPVRGLPADLRSGPRVLRGYDAAGVLRYDRIRVVPEGDDVEAYLQELLADPDLAEVHVRALREQCFTYAARRG